MIQLRDLTLARGAQPLIEGANLQIHVGWRVGLVGANGTGKTSLLAMLEGGVHPERGEYERPTVWRVASVSQETPAVATAAVDYVLDGDDELRRIEEQLAAAETAHDGSRIGELHARLQDIGGYGAHARAAALLDGLGFTQDEFAQPVSAFSGGWRMRLNLARALGARADLLLLDEPTNHLDLDAIAWLEKWLAAYRGTLVLVSHDREFLDGCVTHIAHIHARRLTLYAGNYTGFEEQRAAQLARERALYDKQQREVAHLERFVERFRAKATKARQAQSRLKALARMERIAPAHVDAPFDFQFPEPERAPDPLLALQRVSAGYAGRPVLREVELTLRPGTRLGLLGPNGAGKSTLIRLLAGELEPLMGARHAGRGLQVAYFAQHQLEQLRGDESPLQHAARLEPGAREQVLRDYLGGFDFRGAMADRAVASFSGGEKSRLALALIVRTRPNLLLLDEPTNHLDLEMRHALTRALAEYEGSLVLVSHDRALLRTVCDAFVLVVEGRVEDYEGDLEDYLAWLAAHREAQSAVRADPVAGADKTSRREARIQAAADRQSKLARRRPLLKEAEGLETVLAQSHEEKREIDHALADPSFYESPDPDRLKGLALRQAELTRLIEAAEQRWLEVHEALEAIGDLDAAREPQA